MPLPAPKILFLLAGLVPAVISHDSRAQEAISGLADALSPRVVFVTSGGYWEETGEAEPDEATDTTDTEADAGEDATELASDTPMSRGYYRLIAIRGEDNRSQVHLQQIALTPQGPEMALSLGLDEINALGGYVTDIRPEDSTGSVSQAGFAAYIYLKTDPTVNEPDTWVVYIDDIGEIRVERSSN